MFVRNNWIKQCAEMCTYKSVDLGPLLGGIVFLREIERLNKRYVCPLSYTVSRSLYYKTDTEHNNDCETFY